MHVAAAIEAFRGYKTLYIQDEYENTELARRWIVRLGCNVVFTCVPAEHVSHVYPPARFPRTQFLQVLT